MHYCDKEPSIRLQHQLCLLTSWMRTSVHSHRPTMGLPTTNKNDANLEQRHDFVKSVLSEVFGFEVRRSQTLRS